MGGNDLFGSNWPNFDRIFKLLLVGAGCFAFLALIATTLGIVALCRWLF